MPSPFFLILNDLKKFLTELGKELKVELIKELLAQGHKATGKLISSIDSAVQSYTDKIELSVFYLKYGIYLEQGIKPSQYKKMPSRAEINALAQWLKIKRIVSKIDKKTYAFAWAIAIKHRKKGFPSPGARRFSPSGRILRFQTIVLRSKQQKIIDRISDITDESISTTLEDLVNNITKRYS